VGLVALAEAERGGEVAGEHVDLLDVGNQRLVDGLLVGRPAAGNLLLLCIVSVLPLSPVRASTPDTGCSYLGLLSLLEEGILASLLLGLLGGEVLRPRDLLNLGLVDAGKVDLDGCGDDVSRVDATKGNTVDLEGAGDEQDALVEVLEQDDALAAEPTSEQDQDGTGLEGVARSPRADGLADLRDEPMSVSNCSQSHQTSVSVLPQSCLPPLGLIRLRFPHPHVSAPRSPWAVFCGLQPAHNRIGVQFHPICRSQASHRTQHQPRKMNASTYLARLGLVLSRVPFLSLLGRVRDRPSRLAKGLCRRGRHRERFGCLVD